MNIDHIIELHIPRKLLVRDFSRHLSFTLTAEKHVDQRWLRFKGLLLEPDWFVAATVLCRRLCIFGCLTLLGTSPCSPVALPDPIILPNEVSQGSLLT